MTPPEISTEEKECLVVVCALNDLRDRGLVRTKYGPVSWITPKGISLADQFLAEGIHPSVDSVISVINTLYSPDPEELFWLTLLVYLWFEDPETVESMRRRDEE